MLSRHCSLQSPEAELHLQLLTVANALEVGRGHDGATRAELSATLRRIEFSKGATLLCCMVWNTQLPRSSSCNKHCRLQVLIAKLPAAVTRAQSMVVTKRKAAQNAQEAASKAESHHWETAGQASNNQLVLRSIGQMFQQHLAQLQHWRSNSIININSHENSCSTHLTRQANHRSGRH